MRRFSSERKLFAYRVASYGIIPQASIYQSRRCILSRIQPIFYRRYGWFPLFWKLASSLLLRLLSSSSSLVCRLFDSRYNTAIYFENTGQVSLEDPPPSKCMPPPNEVSLSGHDLDLWPTLKITIKYHQRPLAYRIFVLSFIEILPLSAREICVNGGQRPDGRMDGRKT